MKHELSHYIPLSPLYPQTYFAGANTDGGFCSAYPELIRETELDALFILKGGSGTGKSSLMRACAADAAEHGAAVTLLLCSSDPESADAVILEGQNGRRCAILDGTAPHTVEPELPGAVGEIVSLGQYWSTDALRAQRDAITQAQRAKKDAYARAYRYLAAASELRSAEHALLADAIQTEKLHAAAARLAATLTKDPSPRELCRHTYALTMRGAYHLTTLRDSAKRPITVLDSYGSAFFFTEALRHAALSRGCSLVRAPEAYRLSASAQLYFPASSVCCTVSQSAERDGDTATVNMQRFLDRTALASCRAKLRFSARCRAEMLDGALASLADAAAAHFSLEQIYGSAMDFSGVREETARITARIAALLQA